MIQTRTYRLRGKRTEIREVVDIFAVRGSPTARRSADLDEELQNLGVSLDEIRAIEKAGWAFITPTELGRIAEPGILARVFIKSGGRLALSTGRLNLQLAEKSSPEESMLASEYGVRLGNPLKFAPGLFEAVVEGDSDALAVAQRLVDDGVAVMAEPEFIEVIRPR